MLGLLLLRPEGSLHVREIARLAGLTAGTLSRELRMLTEAGLLLREAQGNQVLYRANRASPIYPELAEIFRKTAGLADVVREALATLVEKIVVAFLFGSMAEGTDKSSSDVDLLVVGDAGFSEIVAAAAPLRERLGREVNPVVMTTQGFCRTARVTRAIRHASFKRTKAFF